MKWVVTSVLAALMLVAAGSKLPDPAAFAGDIMNFRLVPWWAANVLALWVPWVEVAVAVALLTPGWRKAGAGLTLGLLAGFTLALLTAWGRGLDLECGCFGSQTSTTVGWALVRNTVLLVAAGWLVVRLAKDGREGPGETRGLFSR